MLRKGLMILLIGLALVGLFDQWIDFRKLSAAKASG